MSDQDRQLEPETPAQQEGPVSRRQFVTTVAGATAAAMIVPRHVLGRGFQAPSDTVNIATVGINGMGSSNTTQVMTQNIVAICDCDFGLLDNKLKEWTDRANTAPAAAGAGRQGGQGRGGGGPAAPARPSVSELRTVQGAAGGQHEVDAGDRQRRRQALRRSATAEAEEVQRLPGDDRQTEGHRRRHYRDAGSHARDHRLGRDGRRQARLRAEADVLVGARSAASREEGAGEESRHADGQPGPFAGRRADRPGIPDGRRDRRHHGSARLDQPPARLLAAGRAAASRRAAARTSARSGGTTTASRAASPLP